MRRFYKHYHEQKVENLKKELSEKKQTLLHVRATYNYNKKKIDNIKRDYQTVKDISESINNIPENKPLVYEEVKNEVIELNALIDIIIHEMTESYENIQGDPSAATKIHPVVNGVPWACQDVTNKDNMWITPKRPPTRSRDDSRRYEDNAKGWLKCRNSGNPYKLDG